MGVVVSKKNAKRAVSRNRIKRLIRENFRLQQATIGAIDAIVLARKGLEQLDNQQINEILQQSWRKLIRQSCKKRSGSQGTVFSS